MSRVSYRVLGIAVGFLVAFLAAPAAVPAARADNSIVLPEDASVIVGTLGGQGSLDSIQFDLWSPVTINICPFGSCGSISQVSLGSADADTELIFRVAAGCGEEEDFSNDPAHAQVIPFSDDQWLIAWDLPQEGGEGCWANGDFRDFFTYVTLVPGFDIPPGQILGSGSGWMGRTQPDCKRSQSTPRPATSSHPRPTCSSRESASRSRSREATTQPTPPWARSVQDGRSTTTSHWTSPAAET